MNESPPTLTPAPSANPQPKTPAASVWSLVLGILSIFCLWLLGSIPAIILGIIGMKKASTNPQEFGGKGLALAGIITGGIGILTGLVTMGMYAAMIIPAVKGVEAQASKAQTMSDMQQINLAIQSYALDNDFKYPQTLEDLIPDYLPNGGLLMQEDEVSGNSAMFLYSPAKDENNLSNTPILLSPFSQNGERFVGYGDGRVTTIREPLPEDMTTTFGL